jgi:hypothetical protein
MPALVRISDTLRMLSEHKIGTNVVFAAGFQEDSLQG